MMQQAEVTTGTSAEYKDMLSELLTVESFLRDYQVCLSCSLYASAASLCVYVSVCLSVCLFARCVPHFRQHYVCVRMSVRVCLYTVTCYVYIATVDRYKTQLFIIYVCTCICIVYFNSGKLFAFVVCTLYSGTSLIKDTPQMRTLSVALTTYCRTVYKSTSEVGTPLYIGQPAGSHWCPPIERFLCTSPRCHMLTHCCVCPLLCLRAPLHPSVWPWWSSGRRGGSR